MAPQFRAMKGCPLRLECEVEGPRHELLADAALAADEHGGLELGDLADRLEDVRHLRALREDRLEPVVLVDLLF